MVKIPIIAPPIQDSRDFGTQKVGALWLDKSAGQADQGLALGVINLESRHLWAANIATAPVNSRS